MAKNVGRHRPSIDPKSVVSIFVHLRNDFETSGPPIQGDPPLVSFPSLFFFFLLLQTHLYGRLFRYFWQESKSQSIDCGGSNGANRTSAPKNSAGRQ